jgi:hypothetical protein
MHAHVATASASTTHTHTRRPPTRLVEVLVLVLVLVCVRATVCKQRHTDTHSHTHNHTNTRPYAHNTGGQQTHGGVEVEDAVKVGLVEHAARGPVVPCNRQPRTLSQPSKCDKQVRLGELRLRRKAGTLPDVCSACNRNSENTTTRKDEGEDEDNDRSGRRQRHWRRQEQQQQWRCWDRLSLGHSRQRCSHAGHTHRSSRCASSAVDS